MAADSGSRRKLAVTLPGVDGREVCGEQERETSILEFRMSVHLARRVIALWSDVLVDLSWIVYSKYEV